MVRGHYKSCQYENMYNTPGRKSFMILCIVCYFHSGTMYYLKGKGKPLT